MEQLIKDVQEWANSKGLNKPEQSISQLLKISEELGEMNGALLRLNKPAGKSIQMPKFIDGIGDLQVTYIVLCNMNNLDYAKIKPTNYSYDIDFMTPEKWAVNLFNWTGNTSELMAYISKFKMNVANVKGGIIELCKFFDLTPEQCLAAAYKEIKDRTGVMVNGTFIKDEPKEVPQEVDLSELKEGDTVKFMNGTFDGIDRVQKCSGNWDYKLYFSDGTVGAYIHDGKALRSEVPHRAQWDIIEIIKP